MALIAYCVTTVSGICSEIAALLSKGRRARVKRDTYILFLIQFKSVYRVDLGIKGQGKIGFRSSGK